MKDRQKNEINDEIEKELQTKTEAAKENEGVTAQNDGFRYDYDD